MVVYTLRHEQRNLEKVDFFTPLNHIGKHNANTKVFEIVAPILISRGISRIVSDDLLIAL